MTSRIEKGENHMDELSIIRKGQWYYFCCILDLYQASEEFEYEPDIGGYSVFDTAEEAVSSLSDFETEADITAFWKRPCHWDHDHKGEDRK